MAQNRQQPIQVLQARDSHNFRLYTPKRARVSQRGAGFQRAVNAHQRRATMTAKWSHCGFLMTARRSAYSKRVL